MFSKTIKTERLILRPYKIGDISFWHKWNVDSEIQRFMPEPKNKALTDEQQLDYLRECQNDPDGFYWTIVWKENNQPIGSIAVTEINQHHSTGELGIVIGSKDYWNKGIATEAIRNILTLAHAIDLQRVGAELEEGNIGMEKSLTKAGFQKEGVSKLSRIKNGNRINTIRYSVLLDN